MFSISGKKEKKNSKLKIEIKFFRSGLFFTVGRERGNKSNFIFGLGCSNEINLNVLLLVHSFVKCLNILLNTRVSSLDIKIIKFLILVTTRYPVGIRVYPQKPTGLGFMV